MSELEHSTEPWFRQIDTRRYQKLGSVFSTARESDFAGFTPEAVNTLHRILRDVLKWNGRLENDEHVIEGYFLVDDVNEVYCSSFTPVSEQSRSAERPDGFSGQRKSHMKGMKDAAEYYTPPPKGQYPGTVEFAQATNSKKNGTSMLEITVKLDGLDESFTDYLITDGTAKGAGMHKPKLRGLGINVDSNEEIPDTVLAQQIIGRRIVVELDHERAQQKDSATGNYVDAEFIKPDGSRIPLYRGKIAAILSAQVAGFTTPPNQPQPYGAPAAPPQQFAAQPFAQPAPVPQQQFQPQPVQQQMQYPPQPQQQFAGYPQPGQPTTYPAPAPQFAQPQFAQPQQAPQQQMQQPPQYPPQAPVQMQPMPAPVPWATQPNGAAPAQPEEPAKRGGRGRVKDAAS